MYMYIVYTCTCMCVIEGIFLSLLFFVHRVALCTCMYIHVHVVSTDHPVQVLLLAPEFLTEPLYVSLIVVKFKQLLLQL